MNKSNEVQILKEYFNIINDRIETLYDDGDGDDKELRKLLNQIDLIKLDDNNDFHECFKNQLYNLINPEGDNHFFDFKQQKGKKILEFIHNSNKESKALNQEKNKNEINHSVGLVPSNHTKIWKLKL